LSVYPSIIAGIMESTIGHVRENFKPNEGQKRLQQIMRERFEREHNLNDVEKLNEMGKNEEIVLKSIRRIIEKNKQK